MLQQRGFFYCQYLKQTFIVMKKYIFLSVIVCFLSAFVACEEPEPIDENQTTQNPNGNNNNGNGGEVEPYLCLHTLQGHSNSVRSIGWSPDGTKIASASWDGTAKIWQLNE